MKIAQLLSLKETDDVVDADDDHDDGSYEREKKVSVLILRVFRKCGIEVAEHDSQHSGVRDRDDRWGYDVLYSDDDKEAMVTVVEAELSQLVKLNESGLIDGKCEIMATSDQAIRLTFKVHANIASGNASLD
jgi:hypothetical protein